MLHSNHFEQTESSAYPVSTPFVVPSKPLIWTLPRPECEVCVIVPVRDEATTIVATLQALRYQQDLAGFPLHPNRYEVIVLANNCRDDTAAIARRFAQNHRSFKLHVAEIQLPIAEAHVGRARRILMDEAYRRLMLLRRSSGIIASTDGDTQVTPTWIAAMLAEFERGADAVGGCIVPNVAEQIVLDAGTSAYYQRDVIYRLLRTEYAARLDPDPFDPWPRHYHHTGASLALTANIYAYVGGLPPLCSSEDIALYRALLRFDARFRHSPHVRVVTSMRQLGRTIGGMADQLSAWESMARTRQIWLVESVETMTTRLCTRRQLRWVWQCNRLGYPPTAQTIAPLANTLRVEPIWLRQQLALCLPFGALYETVKQQAVATAPQRSLRVDIVEAIHDLCVRLAV